MLSILIPTYNYNTFPLVKELYNQCISCNIIFEIICLDDASSDYSIENQNINKLSNCYYYTNKKNLGRTTTRNKLVDKAIYDWFLFLDSDVIPVNSNFIKNYLSYIGSKYNIVLGGYCYQDILPNTNSEFRYKYGKEREEKPAVERNQSPYKYIFSGNFLIQKTTFLNTNYKEEENHYGMDVLFSYQLFIKKTNILHIENPIYHLGLETNEKFFTKSLKAVESRKKFLIDSVHIEKTSPLIKAYKSLKNTK